MTVIGSAGHTVFAHMSPSHGHMIYEFLACKHIWPVSTLECN